MTMDTNSLMQGLTLMGLGMGFVLSFLCILIAGMFGMSAVVGYLNKIFPEKVEVVEKKSNNTQNNDAAIAVALAAILARK